VRRIQPATYERLERHDYVGEGEDRIASPVRIGPVAAEPLYDYAEVIA
jgi:hypothetical protein